MSPLSSLSPLPRRSAAFVTLAALALLVVATAARATPSVSGADTGHEKRWQRSAFTLELLDTAPSIPRHDALTALRSAARSWNAVGVGTEINAAYAADEDDLTADPVQRDGKNHVGIFPGVWPWPAEAGAVTVTWTNAAGDEIVEVDVALNPRFHWTLGHNGDSGQFDLTNVLTHELGHVLGLPDSKDAREATMFYLILPGETLKRDLAHQDEARLLKLYEGIDDPSPGCSSAGRDTTAGAAVVLLALLVARRRR